MVILFNIIMYVVVWGANQDAYFNVESSSNIAGNFEQDGEISTNTDVKITSVSSITDGFKVSVFGFPDWFNVFYVLFQSILVGVAVYSLIRGLA